MKQRRLPFFSILLVALVAVASGIYGTERVGLGSKTVAETSTDFEVLDLQNGLQLEVDENDLEVTYGEYVRIPIHLNQYPRGNVSWEIVEAELPNGLETEDVSQSEFVISGYVAFTGTWCFTLAATESSTGDTGYREICLFGNDNPELNHPRFETPSYLRAQEISDYFTEVVSVESLDGRPVTLYIERGNVPEDVSFDVEGSSTVVASGWVSQEGRYYFVVNAIDDFDRETSRQFQFHVYRKVHDCGPNEYFDTNLNRCVPDPIDSCPSGTYYDPELDRCISYPIESHCPNGYYRDYAGHCVPYRRICPIGWHYSRYENRCLPNWPTHYCPIGYKYNYYLEVCVRDTWYGCPWGYHWDYSRLRCVRHDWDRRDCRFDERWSDHQHRCIPRDRVCGPGTHWDRHRDRCEPNRPDHRCPSGHWWSRSKQRCVHKPDEPRPMPMPPGPMPMPMPMPPGPMPMPMPPGPMPMPMPPGPMPMPMPPGPMPMPIPPGPMPMPMPPGPMPMPMPIPPGPMPIPPGPMPIPPGPMPMPMPPGPMPMPMDPGGPMGMGGMSGSGGMGGMGMGMVLGTDFDSDGGIIPPEVE